jgi:hypothetical protein
VSRRRAMRWKHYATEPSSRERRTLIHATDFRCLLKVITRGMSLLLSKLRSYYL